MASTSSPAKSSNKHTRKPSDSRSHRRTASLQKIAIKINAYDLLPPGRLSSIFWTFGVGLLHTGLVINDKEYAFGGHDRRGITGVYWTKPQQEPPGGTFRTEYLQGFTYCNETEVDEILREAALEFLGTSYNVLTRNCNHFTSHLCVKLTGKPAPAWINRAASIGVALPCVVPEAWISPPEAEEETVLVPRNGDRGDGPEDEGWSSDMATSEEGDDHRDGHSIRAQVDHDEAGRFLPGSERADMRTVL